MSNYCRAYQENSYVFITMVTYKRNPILIKNIELLRSSFRKVENTFKFEIFGIVILPDHIHMIIKPENIKEYPIIVKSIKAHFSRKIDKEQLINIQDSLTASKIKKKEQGVWQRRYWEHTIRDENDLYIHLDYIHYNPVKHEYVENVKDWKYSSFHKFVRQSMYDINWGSNHDIQRFKDINLE
jgi:putative transposase